MAKAKKIIAADLHARAIEYDEQDRCISEFREMVERHFGVAVDVRIEPHPNTFLNSCGDRTMVAYEATT